MLICTWLVPSTKGEMIRFIARCSLVGVTV